MSEVLGTSEIPSHSPRDNDFSWKRMGRTGHWLLTLAIRLCLMFPDVGFAYIIILAVLCGHILSKDWDGKME